MTSQMYIKPKTHVTTATISEQFPSANLRILSHPNERDFSVAFNITRTCDIFKSCWVSTRT